MKAIPVITVLVLIFCYNTGSLNYVEVFRDDFNSNAVDKSKWRVIDWASTVNQELEYYVPDEVWQEGGNLVLQSQRRNYGDRQYTSGKVESHFELLYGEVEWSAKLPKGKGLWPALWLCCATSLWPPEIDVMEARGDIPNKMTVAVHYGTPPHNGHVTLEHYGPDFTADFHKFKVLWDPNQVVFYVDGQEIYKVTDRNIIPHEKMFLIMNTAVGGTYPGSPDQSTPFPQHFKIDWVTVHRWQ
jgi:beta-glucanase (GH16 family)